jgi:RNA 3'-terminal phosphate cyclase
MTRARTGKAVSLSLLRRGRNPGGKGAVHLVPLYVGVEVASIGKKFAIIDAIGRAAARLPQLYLIYAMLEQRER